MGRQCDEALQHAWAHMVCVEVVVVLVEGGRESSGSTWPGGSVEWDDIWRMVSRLDGGGEGRGGGSEWCGGRGEGCGVELRRLAGVEQ